MVTATEYLEYGVQKAFYPTIDDAWAQFYLYLAKDLDTLSPAMLESFRRRGGEELEDLLEQWMVSKPSQLLKPGSNDLEAQLFREFNQDPFITAAAFKFMKHIGCPVLWGY